MNSTGHFSPSKRHFSRSPSNGCAAQLDAAGSSPSEYGSDRHEVFGLFRLDKEYSNPSSGLLKGKATVYNADVIAIHGLGGSAYRTWTHSNGRFWLRDFAPNEFPGARIYTFGYDSAVAFSRGSGSMDDFARSFLGAIQAERRQAEEKQRPIILVCHSMGGIVAKLAITIAKKEPDMFPGIGNAIAGILFLGTPHRGSRYATYAYILATTANSLIIGTQASRLVGRMRSDILKTLKTHAPELITIAEDFRKYAGDIRIRSFVEGANVRGLNRRVVDDNSARVGVPSEKVIPMPGYDHKDICRHSSTGDTGMRLIFFEIEGCIRQAISRGQSAKVSYIPFERNQRFVGQKKILKELDAAFGGHPPNQEVALYGLGGIGKSQIAIEFAYSVRAAHPEMMIFWVFGANKDRFEQDYKEVARRLEIPGFNALDADILSLVKSTLEETRNWMMIVDNADDMSVFYGKSASDINIDVGTNSLNIYHEDGLSRYIPRGRSGSILYTTRTKEDALRLTSEGHSIHVGEMENAELLELFKSKLNDHLFQDEADDKLNEQDMVHLIEQLDRLPLAIVQAASFIRHKSWSISRYLRNMQMEGSNSSFKPLLHNFRDKTRDQTVKNSVFMTWVVTMKQLEAQEPQAAQTLWLMSLFNRQNIPWYLLGGRDDHNAWTSRTVQEYSNYSLDISISTLISYSFISVSENDNGDTYTLHRLVQMFTRYWLEEKGLADEWAVRALQSILRVFPVVDYEDWKISAELLPHVHAIVDSKEISKLPAYELGVLLTAAATYLRMKAQFPRALEYINLALETLRSNLGNDDPVTIEAIYCLGRYQESQRQYDKAEETFRSAIRSSSIALRPDHPILYRGLAYLSNILRVQKRYGEAETEARLSLRGLKSYTSHRDGSARITATLSLARTLGNLQRYDEALGLQHDCATSLLDIFGPDHPRYLVVAQDLAVTLRLANKLPEAMTASQKVLEQIQKIYGPEHPRTVNIEYNIAQLWIKQGDFRRGEEYMRRLLQILERQVGIDNAETVKYLHSLAFCLENQQRFSEALECYENAHLKMRAGFGPENEGTRVAASHVERLRQLSHSVPALGISATPDEDYYASDDGLEVTENPRPSHTHQTVYYHPSDHPFVDDSYVAGAALDVDQSRRVPRYLGAAFDSFPQDPLPNSSNPRKRKR